jgi:hypothetical protein
MLFFDIAQIASVLDFFRRSDPLCVGNIKW